MDVASMHIFGAEHACTRLNLQSCGLWMIGIWHIILFWSLVDYFHVWLTSQQNSQSHPTVHFPQRQSGLGPDTL